VNWEIQGWMRYEVDTQGIYIPCDESASGLDFHTGFKTHRRLGSSAGLIPCAGNIEKTLQALEDFCFKASGPPPGSSVICNRSKIIKTQGCE